MDAVVAVHWEEFLVGCDGMGFGMVIAITEDGFAGCTLVVTRVDEGD